MNGPIEFLDAIAGHTRQQSQSSADRPVRLAVVDPAYAGHPALPKVTFEGESTMGLRTYAYSYPVNAGDRVALLPIGNTYLIIGRVGGPSALPVSFGGTGRTSVTAGKYLKGNGAAAMSEVTLVEALEPAICGGAFTMTMTAGTTVAHTWTYDHTLTGSVRVVVSANSTVPENLWGPSSGTPGATSVIVYMRRSTATNTTVYGIAIGGLG